MNFWIISVVLWHLAGCVPWENPPRWVYRIYIGTLVLLIAAGVQLSAEAIFEPSMR